TLPMIFVSVADGSVRIIEPLNVTDLAWIDNSSLARVGSADTSSPSQLWRQPYPDGGASRLSNDLNAYTGVSLTSDADGLLTGRREFKGSIWIGDSAANRGSEIAQPLGDTGILGALAWAPDRLIFTTVHPALYAIDAKVSGAEAREIFSGARSPAVSSDGRTFVYAALKDAAVGSLWKADSDGRNAMQLAGGNNFWITITPDGQSVIYVDASIRPWIVPLAGGK